MEKAVNSDNAAKYRVLEDGEGVSFRSREKFKLACCDCGLVHDVVLVASKSWIGLALRRNKRATAAQRRKRK
jgi:hypothetical protein